MTYAFFSRDIQTNTPPLKHVKLQTIDNANVKTHTTTEQQQQQHLLRDLLRSGWLLALRFGKRTTIHGLDRLLGSRASRSERFIWLCTFITAFLGAVYVCLKLSRRYNEGHFQTVVDSTRFPVYNIPFPVVTICNQNRLNWQRIGEAKQLFLPNENSTQKLELFERVVSAYDDLRFGHFQSFDVLRNESLEQLNHVNFSLVVEFMTWRCEEMLTNCIWRHYNYNCCDIFSRRRSQQGLCLSFNTLETIEGKRMKLLDPLWPWRTGNAGPTSALTVRVLINPEKHYPGRVNEKGLNVMITEPYVWHKDPFIVPTHTHTLVEIEPVVYFYDNDTRSIGSDQRECVFDDERNSRDFKSLNGYVYMIENCLSECHQEYLVRYCNCTLDLLFPPGQYRSCRAKDLLCLAENNIYFMYYHQPGEERFVRNQYAGMVCKCFRNCYSLNYLVDVRPSFLPTEVYDNVSYVDLDLHFRFETMMVYRTSLVFGWIDLMVSFGGIAGLFLGCSLISGMELAYFLCIEIPANLIAGIRKRIQRRKSTIAIMPKKNKKEIEEGVVATLNWSRTRFQIQQQLEQYMLQVKANSDDKEQQQQQQHNNWQRYGYGLAAHHKHVISK